MKQIGIYTQAERKRIMKMNDAMPERKVGEYARYEDEERNMVEGKAMLWANQKKNKQSSPDYLGKLYKDAKWMDIAAWVGVTKKGHKYISLKGEWTDDIKNKYRQQQEAQQGVRVALPSRNEAVQTAAQRAGMMRPESAIPTDFNDDDIPF